MADHFSTMTSFIKSADYLTKPKQKRSSGNAFGISRRKDYTSEEKLFFVNLVVEGGNSKASVAKQYDIPESTLRGWCKPKHKDKLEKEALDRKQSSNVFDTPSPSSSSSSAGSGVTSATALYHQYKDSPFEPHLVTSSAGGLVPTLQIPKVENHLYNSYSHHQTPLRCSSGMGEPHPLIKEERDEEVLNLSNKTPSEHHLSSPILTQCLNSMPGAGLVINGEPSPSNSSIKSMQHMKHALLDMKSPNNLIDIHQNISSMFQSYSNRPDSCKLSPKPRNSPSPVKFGMGDKLEESNANKRKYDAFVNDSAKDVTSNSPYDLYKKDVGNVIVNNNNSEFYKNYEQFLNSKRTGDMYINNVNNVNKIDVKRDNMSISSNSNPVEAAPAVNHHFKNYLESMVKAQKLSTTPGNQEQFKLAAQQLWLQQLALNQLAASSMSQLPNSLQQQQTAAALQQQQLLYERQLLNSRLNQQTGASPGSVAADEKIYSWTSQLHANQRELEEKLKLLIQTQQQILSDKNQQQTHHPSAEHAASLTISHADSSDRIKRMRTMNVRDMLESHRQSLDKSHESLDRSHESLDKSHDDDDHESERHQYHHDDEETDQEVKETLDLSSRKPEPRLLTNPSSPINFSASSPMNNFRRSPSGNFASTPARNFSPCSASFRPPSHPSSVIPFRASPTSLNPSATNMSNPLRGESPNISRESSAFRTGSSPGNASDYRLSSAGFRPSPLSRLPESPKLVEDSLDRHDASSPVEDAKPIGGGFQDLDFKPLPHLDDNYLNNALLHGEQFLADLEKVSHPMLTLQHIRQVRDLLCKLRTPVFENNNITRDGGLEDPNCKSKRKSLLNIVHNLTN
uniref:HTH psq-type domain-containing protein n=1 Tax=Cacopsylla melanoneura TaxID=428564 RepID=A0A8D9A0N2_9HEMI